MDDVLGSAVDRELCFVHNVNICTNVNNVHANSVQNIMSDMCRCGFGRVVLLYKYNAAPIQLYTHTLAIVRSNPNYSHSITLCCLKACNNRFMCNTIIISNHKQHSSLTTSHIVDCIIFTYLFSIARSNPSYTSFIACLCYTAYINNTLNKNHMLNMCKSLSSFNIVFTFIIVTQKHCTLIIALILCVSVVHTYTASLHISLPHMYMCGSSARSVRRAARSRLDNSFVKQHDRLYFSMCALIGRTRIDPQASVCKHTRRPIFDTTKYSYPFSSPPDLNDYPIDSCSAAYIFFVFLVLSLY